MKSLSVSCVSGRSYRWWLPLSLIMDSQMLQNQFEDGFYFLVYTQTENVRLFPDIRSVDGSGSVNVCRDYRDEPERSSGGGVNVLFSLVTCFSLRIHLNQLNFKKI